MINGSTSLINKMNIKHNSKVVYEGNNLFLTTHVKSLIEYSDDYARFFASGEYFYLDSDNKISDNNFGYVQRLAARKMVMKLLVFIALNRYSVFKVHNLICYLQVKSKLVLI